MKCQLDIFLLSSHVVGSNIPSDVIGSVWGVLKENIGDDPFLS